MEAATLAYLTNPAYFSEITEHMAPPTSSDEDVIFYRRRLISLFKDLLNGEKVCDSLDDAHNQFVRLAIAHFKRVDTDEILQKEFAKGTCGAEGTHGAKRELSERPHADASGYIQPNMNHELFSKEVSVPTLDDFILKTKPVFSETPPPHKRVINLREEQFRHKGVPKKQVSIYEAKV